MVKKIAIIGCGTIGGAIMGRFRITITKPLSCYYLACRFYWFFPALKPKVKNPPLII